MRFNVLDRPAGVTTVPVNLYIPGVWGSQLLSAAFHCEIAAVVFVLLANVISTVDGSPMLCTSAVV
ncbi:hypothetical protein D3C75_845100 [compost metagenome]